MRYYVYATGRTRDGAEWKSEAVQQDIPHILTRLMPPPPCRTYTPPSPAQLMEPLAFGERRYELWDQRSLGYMPDGTPVVEVQYREMP